MLNRRRVLLAGGMVILPHRAFAQSSVREIRIATEGAYAPWTFHNSRGELDGFDVDVAKDLCRRMGARCTLIAASFDSLLPSLVDGRYDAVMTGWNITPRRRESIDFSIPYAFSASGFITRKGDPLARLPYTRVFNIDAEPEQTEAALQSLRTALAGKTVGGASGGTSSWFEAAFPKSTLRRYRTLEQVELDIKANRIDAGVGFITAWRATERQQGSELSVFGDAFRGGSLGQGVAAGVRKGNDALRSDFDKAIREAIADGGLRQISMKWFGSDETPAKA
jgi:octopine/nopaline transport system substrate-binding protein